jgi:hypothetical protein
VKIFQRKIEDFECGYCGRKVVGNGYTNHCPKCLYSKHVDVHPGDRAAECGGLMVPVFLEPDKNERKLTHRCVMCGHEKKNRVSEEDDFEALLGLSKRIVSVK